MWLGPFELNHFTNTRNVSIIFERFLFFFENVQHYPNNPEILANINVKLSIAHCFSHVIQSQACEFILPLRLFVYIHKVINGIAWRMNEDDVSVCAKSAKCLVIRSIVSYYRWIYKYLINGKSINLLILAWFNL